MQDGAVDLPRALRENRESFEVLVDSLGAFEQAMRSHAVEAARPSQELLDQVSSAGGRLHALFNEPDRVRRG